jgi:hypothetical protein
MVLVRFTQNVQRHIACPPRQVNAATVREALEVAFHDHAAARGYFLDDQNALRKHIAVFIDGVPVRDRVGLSDALTDGCHVDVMQALSGG